MKSMLYVGAALMIGASIYGFVDYEKAKHKKEFTGMYKAKPATEEPAADVKAEKLLPEAEKKVAEKKEAAVTENKTAPAEKKEVKKVKKKRKIKREFFGRGGLGD